MRGAVHFGAVTGALVSCLTLEWRASECYICAAQSWLACVEVVAMPGGECMLVIVSGQRSFYTAALRFTLGADWLVAGL